MYVLAFVNRVRSAQGFPPIDTLPERSGPEDSPLEIAMGCRFEQGSMRLSSPEAAGAVAQATGLPMGTDGNSVLLPSSPA